MQKNLDIFGNIKRWWRFPNKSKNLSTRYLGYAFQRIVKLFAHLIHPRCQGVSESQVAFEVQKELVMDVVENESDALARYEAEVAGHR